MSRESRTPPPPDRTREPASEQTGTHVPVAGMDEARPSGADELDGNGGGTAHGAEIEALRKELAVAEENSRAQRELYLRAAAEIDNVRKRAQRDIEQAHRYAVESFAHELLAVRDSLALALHNGANADAATLLAGEEATLKLLDRAFAKFSIRQIDPVGQRFDPNQHEAMLMQESADAAPNTVLQVVQSGYELNGRLLRPARVIVARAAGDGPAGGAGARGGT